MIRCFKAFLLLIAIAVPDTTGSYLRACLTPLFSSSDLPKADDDPGQATAKLTKLLLKPLGRPLPVLDVARAQLMLAAELGELTVTAGSSEEVGYLVLGRV